MARPNPHHPKVFISYSHDSLEHSDRVRELSDRLRADGIDCVLDQYEVSPPEGWSRWADKQIRDADFVLMICTETYYLRVMGEEKPGIGLGVRWEGNVIYQHISNEESLNTKFIPVLLESGQIDHIPTPLQGVARYAVQTKDGYEELCRRLTNQPRVMKPVLGDVPKLPALKPKERKRDFFAASLTNLPFERNPFFTGREQILKELHQAFGKKSPGSTIQAISGLGGLGKTQTVIEYAYRHRDDYRAVFWVRADTQLALSTGFVEIARLLDLREKDAQNPDDAVRAVMKWLEENSEWLLIFDNADSPELLKALRSRSATGHVLLTSRASVFHMLGLAKPIEIVVMSPEEALEFLFTRTGRDDNNAEERKASEQLAEELGFLPLALEQAGAFITAKKARFQDYLAGYRKRKLKLLKESRPVTGDYPESVATTWGMNFSEIEKVSQAASDLLRASAFLSPDSIPFELITEGRPELGSALSAALADVDDDPLALNNVLEPLTRYSLIRLDSDLQTYSIHRLVQDVLRDGMAADTHRLWAERIIRALNQAIPDVEFENWQLCERLLPHAKAAANLIENWSITFEEASRVVNQAGFYSKQRGQYADAELLYKQSLTIIEKTMEPDHPDLALSLNNMAAVYRVQARYAEAERLYKRSERILEKALGADHLLVALSLNNVAEVCRIQRKFTEAEPLYKRSLATREKALGPDHPDVAAILNNLAALYHDQGDYTEAEPLVRRSLTLLEKALGPEHPSVANALNNVAEVCRIQRKFTEAEPLYKRSLAIREKALGPNHPDVAATLNNLAQLSSEQGNYAEAEPLFTRSLSVFEGALGLDHPSVAAVLENYGALLHATHRYAEASEMNARAAAIRAKNAQQNSGE